MYTAVVRHNGGHGSECHILFQSESIERVVEVVRGVEKLGFTFSSDEEDGVMVFRTEEGVVYDKGSIRRLDGEQGLTVFFRIWYKGHLREEWIDWDLAPEFNGSTLPFYQNIKTSK